MSRYGDRFTEHVDATRQRRALCDDFRNHDDWHDIRRYANHVAGKRVIDVLNLVQHELAAATRSLVDDLTSPEQLLEDMRDRVIDLLGEEGATPHENRGVAT